MLSLFSSLIAWIFRLSTIKFIVFGALFLLLEPLMALLMQLIEAAGIASIPALFSALPSSLLYFLKVFRFEEGLTLIVAAELTRFFIRRLPVVG